MLNDEDRGWLKALSKELYPDPPDAGQKYRDLFEGRKARTPPRESVTLDEVRQLCDIIERSGVLCVMIASGMFGGCGIQLFEHSSYPGTEPEEVFVIGESKLPDLDVRSVYDHIRGVPKKERAHRPGTPREDAWELFSKYTHSEKNLGWVKFYKMEMALEIEAYYY